MKILEWFKRKWAAFVSWCRMPEDALFPAPDVAGWYGSRGDGVDDGLTHAKSTDYVGADGKRIDEVVNDDLRRRLDGLADDFTPTVVPDLPDDGFSTLTRRQFKGVDIDLEFANKMSTEARTDFLASVHKIVTEPAFKRVLHTLMNRQVEVSMLQASDWESVKFGRATVNGIALVDEEFEALDAEYVESVQPKEEFDKQSIT